MNTWLTNDPIVAAALKAADTALDAAPTELTPIGEQYVIPGCDRDSSTRTLKPIARWQRLPMVRAMGDKPTELTLTPDEFRDARGKLGKLWGLDRPLTLSEMGRVLRLGGVRHDQSVRDYERGKTAISGPLSVLIELMLAGAKPAGIESVLPAPR